MRVFTSLFVFLMISVSGLVAVSAQTSPAVMAAKIEALERQLRALQQSTYATRNGDSSSTYTVAAPPLEGADRRLVADLSAQLGTLERQIRQLNGRLEEYEYRQNQLNETVEQLRNQMALQREQMLSLNTGAVGAVSGTATEEPSVGSQNQEPASVAADGGQALTAPADIELPEGDAAVQYQYAFSFIQKNDLDSGRVAMEQFMERNTGDERIPNAIFWLGRINMQQGSNAEAARLFLSLIEDHPNHSRRVDALVDLADVLVAMNAPQDACNALAEFRRDEDKASDRLIARAARVSKEHSCNLF